jgi:hypothetical protein
MSSPRHEHNTNADQAPIHPEGSNLASARTAPSVRGHRPAPPTAGAWELTIPGGRVGPRIRIVERHLAPSLITGKTAPE